MKNSIISIILFFTLLGFVLYANTDLLNLCDSIVYESEKIETLVTAGEWEDAYTTSINLITILKEDSVLASIYINHSDLDNMINEAVKLSQYVKYEDKTESQASACSLKYSSSNIKRLYLTTIENIF